MNQRAISFLAFSTESLPWQTLRPTSCPRISTCAPRKYGKKIASNSSQCFASLRSKIGCTYDGEVTTDGTRLRGKRVGGTEDLAASLDSVTALPDHGADGAAAHVGNQSREEGLVREVGVVLLKVLLGGSDELDGGKLEATVLEARDDGANQAALLTVSVIDAREDGGAGQSALEERGALLWEEHTWTPSGLMAMKLCKCQRC